MKTSILRLLPSAFLLAMTSCASPGNAAADASASPPLTLNDYVLTGRYSGGQVTFTLHALAKTQSNAGEIVLVTGPISLASVPDALSPLLTLNGGNIVLKFSGWSGLDVNLPFRAQVNDDNGWKTVEFTPAPSNIRKIVLEGWPATANVELTDASQLVSDGTRVTANLPGSGPVRLRWREAAPKETGKLFFSADGVVTDIVAPGILRQTDDFTLRILQGNIDRVDLELTGDGEITRVDGDGILNWTLALGDAPNQRKLSVQFNAPKTGSYPFSVQLQTPLPALPATVTPPHLAPIGALNYGGRLQVQNEGAVRLDVSDTQGLSQISPEQLPAVTPPPAPRGAAAGRRGGPAAPNVTTQGRLNAALTALDRAQRALATANTSNNGGRFVLQAREDSNQALADMKEAVDFDKAHPGSNQLSYSAAFADASQAPLIIIPATVPPRGTPNLITAINALNQAMNELLNNPADDNQGFVGDIGGYRAKIMDDIKKTGSDLVAALNSDYPPPTRANAQNSTSRGAPELVSITSAQAFAYRFADPAFAYSIHADNVLPELNVDGLLLYHLGDNGANVEALFQLDIREAPLRELTFTIPADWIVSPPEAPNLADYNTKPVENGMAQLRLTFSQPLSGRQAVKLRLERNAAVSGDTWALPPLMVEKAKSARGFVGVTSDASLRLTPSSSGNLTDASTSSFPVKADNLQAVWRFHEDNWAASLKVEHLPSTVQADALQLFTVGDGLVYGSTVINFQIAGAPISVLRLQNTGNYQTVEFTGRDVGTPKRDGDTYEVNFNHPVSGAYTLLATYELPFKATGDTLPLTGMRPLGVQSEQGYVLVGSSHPFTIVSANVSAGVLKLETAEIPAEYRLLCDSPILASYQYSARPFDTSLNIRPLPASETVSQVVDIAELDTRVSTTGEVLTTARYLLKSKGHDHLGLNLPSGAKLWSLTVDDGDVVGASAQDGALLIPLPRKGDPNTPMLVSVKFAQTSAPSDTKDVVKVSAPVLTVPMLVTDWTITGDNNRSLHAIGNAPVVKTDTPRGLNWLGQIAFGSSNVSTDPFKANINITQTLRPNTIAQTSMTDVRSAFWLGIILNFAGILVLRAARGRSSGMRFLAGLAGCVLGITGLWLFAMLGIHERGRFNDAASGREVRLSIPVVESGGTLSFSFANEKAPENTSLPPAQPLAWLLAPGLVFLAMARPARAGLRGTPFLAFGVVLSLAGTLGLPRGPMWFCFCLALVFVRMGLRALAALRSESARISPVPPAVGGVATTVASLAVLLWFVCATPAHAASAPAPKTGLILSMIQNGTIKDDFASIKSDVVWRAENGDKITLLGAPAVLTAFNGDTGELNLEQTPSGDGAMTNYVLTARSSGILKFSFTYQIRTSSQGSSGTVLSLPTPGGLVNTLALDLDKPDLEAASTGAISLNTTPGTDGHLHVSASFAPGTAQLVNWQPRARNLSVEKSVYYADWQQLYTPTAGIVDGYQEAHIRLAQGEIRQLTFSVPPGLTISQVDSEGLASWRFDPDQHKLLVYYEPSRKGPFTVRIHSQAAASPLPYTSTLSPIRLDGVGGEIGLLALATTSEVQLGADTPDGLARINVDDFPATVAATASTGGDALTIRRAYSYNQNQASLKFDATAVVPDVRVNSRQTLSLGEDRVVLAAHLDVTIARAGIFKFSFLLPTGMELESLSGDQLAQWTESDVTEGRVITLNLKNKTMGNASFDLTLSGPGVTSRQDWIAPHLSLREAAKETGELLVIPELGLSPHIKQPLAGLTQINPKDAGVTAEGALVFRLLQNDWSLAFDVETIAPWIQVSALQDVTVREGLTQVTSNLNYDIQNAGVRELRIQLPPAAVGARITGPLVNDSVPVDGQPGQWIVHLQRRAIGGQTLQVSCQILPGATDNKLSITGIRAIGVDSQSGYLTLRARGRLETRVSNPAPALVAADWESIPAELKQGFEDSAPSQVFRVADPAFDLPVDIARHETAEILPAHVVSAALRSLISPEGRLLTMVTVQLHPGDKRNLSLTLPKDARFWFAFVNDKGVSPSQGNGAILIPLEKHPIAGQPATVEFFYEQPLPAAGALSNAVVEGPRFDLPLQNISWKFLLPDGWKISDFSGSWQKVDMVSKIEPVRWRTLDDYLSKDKARFDAQKQQAEIFIQKGNELLQKGQQLDARELFSNAYQISQHDAATNEDARVQWQNLREQQAMVGIANRSNWFGNNNGNSFSNAGINPGAATSAQAPGAGGSAPQNLNVAANGAPVLSQSQVANYTDKQARQILSANPAEDNVVLAKLAKRLVLQQGATPPQPAAIRADIPERGEQVEFTQSLLVNSGAGLSLTLSAGPAGHSFLKGILMLAVIAILLASAGAMTRRPRAA